MDMTVDCLANLDSSRARTRFLNTDTKKKVKEFRVKMRGYKRPDFNRMILDLTKLGWTHEKIAYVLPVAGASTVSEWARGGVPNFDNGDAFVLLWQTETGLQRFPRENEYEYKYKIGQLDIFADGGVVDEFIEQLDDALFSKDTKPVIDHCQFNNGDLVVYTDGQPLLLMVRMHFSKVLVYKFGSMSAPNTPNVAIRKATQEEVDRYALKQWKEEGRKGKPKYFGQLDGELKG